MLTFPYFLLQTAAHSSGSSLQPVFEFEQDKEPQEKNHGSKHVVEIGHDALRTIQSKYNGGQYTNQCSQSQAIQSGHMSMHETKEFPSQRYEHIKHEFSHSMLAKPENNLVVKSQPATTPFLYKTASNGTSTVSETEGNVPLSRSRGQPISHLACLGSSFSKDKQANLETKAYISSDLRQRYPPTGYAAHPRKLERHESWSGKPSIQTCYVPRYSQSRHSSSINRHNSFSDAAMSNSHRYSSVPDLQQGYGQLNHRMQRSQSAMDYSNNPTMSHGCLQEGNKSLSIQNIPMATEGILASAIRNQVKQKRTSSSGSNQSLASCVSMQNISNMQDQAVCGSLAGLFYDSSQSVLSTQLDANLSATLTNGEKKTTPSESPAYGQLSKMSLYMEKELEKMSQTEESDTGKEIQQNSTFQEYTPKCSPIKCSHSLRNRDSIASRDSGYRSRDRSSASSGSVHSIEASAFGRPHNNDTEARHSGLQKASNQNLHQASDENETLNITSLSEKLLAEVVGLQTQSRKMEDDGDLATALALSTSVVSKLTYYFLSV